MPIKVPNIQQNPAPAETLTFSFQGIYDFPNQFSPKDSPDGGVSQAINCVCERPGVLDSRRGYNNYGNTTNGTASQGLTFTPFKGSRFVWCDDNIWYQDTGNNSFAPINSTQYYAPGTYAGSRVRVSQSNGNLYYNSNTGVYKIQSTANVTPRLAGGPQALGGFGTVAASATGPLPNAASVAYRVLWQYFDTNNNLIRGVPCTPIIVQNANTTSNAVVTLTFQIPTTVDSSWTVNVYRSNYGNQIPNIPDDNCQLVYSTQPTNAQLVAKVITFTDNMADLQRGETIYTTEEGITAAEYRPPLAQDMALFKGSMFYVNTYYYQQLFVNIINDGVLTAGDTLTFKDFGGNTLFVLTADTAENATTGHFQVFTGNTAQINIDQTAQSILKICNAYVNNTVIDAYYESTINVTATGQMLFQYRTFNPQPFYILSSNQGYIFKPQIPAANSNINNTSSNTYNQHYVYYSKSLEPEAVPLNNFLAAGSSTTPILRVIPMRDTLVILKSDGIYGITGNDPTTFAIYPMDVQQNLAGINTPDVLNNYLYFVADQGVIQMDEYANHKIISTPIQRTLLQYTTNNYPTYAATAWGMAYQADHSYQFWTVFQPGDTSPQQCFVYNYITGAWTTWQKNFTCGMYDPTTKTQWATNFQAANCQIYQERKSLTDFDYADEEYAIDIIGVSADGATLNIAGALPIGAVVGATVYQNPYISEITAVDTVNTTITVSEGAFWNINSTPTVVVTPIPVSITTNPITAGDPVKQKQFSEYSILVDGTSGAIFTVGWNTDAFIQTQSIDQEIPPGVGPYGTGIYGAGSFGTVNLNNPAARLRNYVPQNSQKCNWLIGTFQTATAFNRVGFQGLSMIWRPLTNRQRS